MKVGLRELDRREGWGGVETNSVYSHVEPGFKWGAGFGTSRRWRGTVRKVMGGYKSSKKRPVHFLCAKMFKVKYCIISFL